jgi:hypothetical protein
VWASSSNGDAEARTGKAELGSLLGYRRCQQAPGTETPIWGIGRVVMSVTGQPSLPAVYCGLAAEGTCRGPRNALFAWQPSCHRRAELLKLYQILSNTERAPARTRVQALNSHALLVTHAKHRNL